ncbi:NIC-domain-containing protein [Metschnikowia bicuspidata]|uniref:Nuclear pore protein n=1 Tax=Metschnikowia bicuspidata TaxID=27322 RepID=A0A4P9ZI15_9ASCO|nr:NIC-domain-containing protein [Metschnikowia bicuspidata]
MSLFGSQPHLQPAQPPASGTGFSFGSAPTNPSTTSTASSTFPTAVAPLTGASVVTQPPPKTGLQAEIAPNASSNKILKDLLESANNLPRLNHGNLWSLHLPLNELQRETRLLCKRDNAGSSYTNAHYLLSGSGINATEIESELQKLSSAHHGNAFGNGPEVAVAALSSDLDPIENYLIAKKDENILAAIEQSLESASRDFDLFINQTISIDWRVRKDDLKRSLGIPVDSKISGEELARSFSWNKALPGNYRFLSPLGGLGPTGVRHFSRERFESNARIVYHLNETRLQQQPFPLCLSFEELSKSNQDLKSKQMGEIWRILADLFNEKFAKTSQEQAFCEDYQLKDNSIHTKKSIVRNSRAYLEQQFYNYMNEIYTKDEKKKPEVLPNNTINKVLYFIEQVIVRKNGPELMTKTLNFNGVPIWALLFYLIRCGLYQEAITLTNTNKDAFDKFDRNFPIYLSLYLKSDGKGLLLELQERISSDFRQAFQFLNDDSPGFDPFKYAVYKLIGKCDLAKKTLPLALNLSIEDWVWFHLLLINEFNPDTASSLLFENYTLENLQRKVLSSGPEKFNASSNNPLYAKTLTLIGLYEHAVQYVYEAVNESEAVHLAISLCYYGLLRTSSANRDDLVSVNQKQQLEVNFSRMLWSFTRSFKISDPKVAAQYLILICISKGGKSSEESSRCHEALRELILLSREFGLLLGELNAENGDKSPGILETQRALINLLDLNSFYRQITEIAASRCEEEGRVFDAVRLYQLCQEYNTVVALLNKFLSEILAMSELNKPFLSHQTYQTADGEKLPLETIDNNFILLNKHIMKVFGNNSRVLEAISSKEKEINAYLLPIVEIREKFVRKEWQAALDAVKQLGLVPIVEDDNVVALRNAAEALASYDVNLVRVVPSLLIIVMTCVLQLHYGLMIKKFGLGGREKHEAERLKAVAKNCIVYAGMLQYRMPRETYSLLVNLESQLQ